MGVTALQFNSQSLSDAATNGTLGNKVFTYSPSDGAYHPVDNTSGTLPAFQAAWFFAEQPGVLGSTNLTLPTPIPVFPQAPASPGNTTLPEAHRPLWVVPTSFNDLGGVNLNDLTPTGFTPLQMRDAYQFETIPNKGQGQTVVIIDFYVHPTLIGSNVTNLGSVAGGAGTLYSATGGDLATFCTAAGIAQADGTESPTLEIVNMTGAAASDSSSSLETSLDVEWVHAISPQAQIVLIQTPTNSLADTFNGIKAAAQITGANVVSMSFGIPEAELFSGFEVGADPLFNGGPELENVNGVDLVSVPAAGNLAWFASAGDSYEQVNWPGVSGYITCVGGTSLTLDGSNNITSEVVWNTTSGLGGSGGGLSGSEGGDSYPAPAYQSTNGPYTIGAPFPEAVQSICTMRGLPDVAYNGDPATGVMVYDGSYTPNPGWLQVGGTSAGAPQWAGFMARVNSGRVKVGELPLNSFQLNTFLYGFSNAQITSALFDITSGSNGLPAEPGYDLCTGLGTPKALSLYNLLVAEP